MCVHIHAYVYWKYCIFCVFVLHSLLQLTSCILRVVSRYWNKFLCIAYLHILIHSYVHTCVCISWYTSIVLLLFALVLSFFMIHGLVFFCLTRLRLLRLVGYYLCFIICAFTSTCPLTIFIHTYVCGSVCLWVNAFVFFPLLYFVSWIMFGFSTTFHIIVKILFAIFFVM